MLLLTCCSPFKKFGWSRVSPGVLIGPFGSGACFFGVAHSPLFWSFWWISVIVLKCYFWFTISTKILIKNLNLSHGKFKNYYYVCQ